VKRSSKKGNHWHFGMKVPFPGEAARRSGMMPPTDPEMISPAIPR
jgi:hypothetical protein